MLRRLKIFFALTFLAALMSVVFLVHYSATRGVSMKIMDSSQLGLKYFKLLKDKLMKGEDLNDIKSHIREDLRHRLFRTTARTHVKALLTTGTEQLQDNTIPTTVIPSTVIPSTVIPSTDTSSKSKEEDREDPVDTLIKTSLKNEGNSENGDEEILESETTTAPMTEEIQADIVLTAVPEKEDDNEDQELCPSKSDTLVGPLFVNQNVPKMEELEKHLSESYGGWVKKGGTWKPTECKARTKMALIVPFRKRYEQLGIFVRHMHPMLKRQNVDYRIVIVEQSGDTPFNRAILFNIGYKEALKLDNYDCLIFHDVDLIPEDDRNEYSCPTSPRHMSVAVDKFNYHLPYASLFGGAGAFKKRDFEEINGFSNKFWGWGGEDDDLYQRISARGYHLTRPSLQIGRYKMIRTYHHQSSKADPNSAAKLRSSRTRMLKDGLNSLKYKVIKVKEEPMYTLATIAVNPKEV